MSFLGLGSILLLSSIVSADTPSVAVRTVPHVDLQKYLGVWHEVARFPNRFQKQCDSDVTAEYSMLPDGRIRVVNRCRQQDGSESSAAGVARVVDPATNAKLKVRFAPSWLSALPFVWGDYWIVGLAEDYSYAVVGTPDRSYLWILSRTPSLDEPAWRSALDIIRQNGFDESKLTKTKQATRATEPRNP
jgi:apolipoprotein D and lipocalin family protein